MRFTNVLAASALLATTAFTSVGPPWISIETPANPFDAATRDAFLLVHAFHHGTPTSFPVSGTAEGIVNGARRTISLELKPTSRPGVYALRQQWPETGTWTLILAVTPSGDDATAVKAVVELAPNGKVASVDVPTTMRNGWRVPAPVRMADVEASLKARAGRVASR
jgi:hypothetical protein